LIIGIDFYQKKLKENKTCAGIVATLDYDFSEYYSTAIVSNDPIEYSRRFSIIMSEILKIWKEKNACYPK
jgi:hypothetical protein